jgi:hypothetical protein
MLLLISTKVKGITRTWMDHMSVDLDYKILQHQQEWNAATEEGTHAKDFKPLGDGQHDISKG